MVAFIILFFLLLFSSCVLQDLFGGTSRSVRIKVTMTPETPSYIGQVLKVLVSTTPRKELPYIRLTTKNFVTGEERSYMQENVGSHEFSIKLHSSQFGFFIETPGRTRQNGNAIWWPSKETYIETEDFTPPNVSVKVSRVNENGNDYTFEVIADESESAVIRRWVTVNGTEYELEGQRQSTRLPLSIGTYIIRGFAQNSYGYVGSSSNKYVEVTPPRSNEPARIGWNHPKQLTPFTDENVTLSAQITDNISYIKRIELRSLSGIKKTYQFDPMVPTYSLRYNLKATRSEKVTLTVTNGNNIVTTDEVDLSIQSHRAPKVTLEGPAGSFPIDESKSYLLKIDTYDGALIDNARFLVNNTTASAFPGIGESSYKKTLTYTVLNGKKYLKAIATDSWGATGQSDEIEVIGYKIDKTPPRIQLYMPSVAYKNVQTDLSFLVQDSDSDLAGIPGLSVLEDNLTLNPLTYDNAFYFAKWTPEGTGTRTIQVTATDTAGNQATATASIQVKDPTGIVRPTVGALSAYPNVLMLGSSVSLVLSVTPPSQNPGGIVPVVEIAVTAPNGGTPYKIGSISQAGYIYTGTYRPAVAGVHTAIALIQWGDDQYTKSCTFRVDAPKPTMVFTVEPEETYIGNPVTLKLSPDTANPNASLTVLEMSVEEEALSWVRTIGAGGSVIYVATKSTLDMSPGIKKARAKIRDSFGEEITTTATFTLRSPNLRITGYKYVTDSGKPPNAYDPTRIEVYMGADLPAAIPINGEVAIARRGSSDERGVAETYPLQRTPSDAYTFVTKEKWIPKEAGLYDISFRLSGVIGSQATETKLATEVRVAAAQLNVGISATPVEIDKIRTGEAFSLVFTVTGATVVDPIKSFTYGISSGSAIHQTETAPTQMGSFTYTHTPPKFSVAGSYTITATAVTISGNTKVLTLTIEVKAPDISISIEASPAIDRITVGRPITLLFSVDGIPNSDKIDSFSYAIWKGSEIYKDAVYLEHQRATRYTDPIEPFVTEGVYTIIATATTAGLSVGVNSRTFTVLSAEIRKKTFALEGSPSQLFIGAPLYFLLELENPNNVSNLSVRMYITDATGVSIPGVVPIGASPTNNNNTTFRNNKPFYISQPGTFTVYASVTLNQVPQIDLPVMRSDSDYAIPPSTVGVSIDTSKQYLAGYEGSLRVTVTIPQGMNIQSPRVLLENSNLGEIDPTPYSSDVSGSSAKYYNFKFRPTIPSSPVVVISIYDTSDLSGTNPLTTKRATLTVVPFNPQVRITSVGNVAFIQAKEPRVRLEIDQIPEFFTGSYEYLCSLSTYDLTVTANEPSILIDLPVQALFNLKGTQAATVTAEVKATGNGNFIAKGQETFDVVLPSFSNLRFPSDVTNGTYFIYEQEQLRVVFNNDQKVSDNSLIQVRLEIEGNPNPAVYIAAPTLSSTTIPASALFDQVVFSKVGSIWATPTIYCLNTNPSSVLATSSGEQLNVYPSTPRVEIIQPSTIDPLFVGQVIKPIVRLIRVPPVVTHVTIALWEEGSSEPPLTRDLILSENDDWIVYSGDPPIVFTEPASFTLVATATSSANPNVGYVTERKFNVVQGDLQTRDLSIADGGSLLFRDEKVRFKFEYAFNNPYRVPSTLATLTNVSNAEIAPPNIVRESPPSTSMNGDYIVFTEYWVIASNTAASGNYRLELVAFSGDLKRSRTTEFDILQALTINDSLISLAPELVNEDDRITGKISITLPSDFITAVGTDNIQPYLYGSVVFEGCDSQPTNHRLYTDPDGNPVWIIEAEGIARRHSDTPGATRQFYARYSVTLDSVNVLSVRKPFSIKNNTP